MPANPTDIKKRKLKSYTRRVLSIAESHKIDEQMTEMNNNIWHMVSMSKVNRISENLLHLNVNN